MENTMIFEDMDGNSTVYVVDEGEPPVTAPEMPVIYGVLIPETENTNHPIDYVPNGQLITDDYE